MVGMLQIITLMGAVYLVMKGVEILQIGLASSRPKRGTMIAIGIVSIIVCFLAAVVLIQMQDAQAVSVSTPTAAFEQ